MTIIGGPCPRCGTRIDQVRDLAGTLLVFREEEGREVPTNWCGRRDCDIHVKWSEDKGWQEIK